MTFAKTHGMSRTREYASWKWMKNNRQGARVCERWAKSIDAFLEDMGPRPPRMSLTRIDADGDYEPGNCRWAARTRARRDPFHLSILLSNPHVEQWEIEWLITEERRASYRSLNKETLSSKSREYYKTNHADRLKYQRLYREINRPALIERSRAFASANRERIRVRARELYYANHERRLLYEKQYAEANREGRLARRRAWWAANRERMSRRSRELRELRKHRISDATWNAIENQKQGDSRAR